MSYRDDRGWAALLDHPPIQLRPLRRSDATAWQALRETNRTWLAPWEATIPQLDLYHRPGGGGFTTLLRYLKAEAKERRLLALAITWQGQVIGQVSVSGIVYGSVCSGTLGYWVSQQYAGRGVVPTAVALSIDHCFAHLALHRIEINIRPENERSLRVVTKLGLREEGLRQGLMHIDGQWRDHRSFAITAEECPSGLIHRCPPIHPHPWPGE